MADQNFERNSSTETGDHFSDNERIVVIGASTGGFGAFKKIISGLPSDFSLPIFIVWHISPEVRGILPQVLNQLNTIPASHVVDSEMIKPGRIYIAPPDHHMIIEDGKVMATHGPKENRFRPAIDPLFRSAAYSYGNRVIGVILSGALDDGTAGMWAIKQYGGTTIVQNPMEAEVPSMPENALREVNIDHCVSLSELPQLLVGLSKEPVSKNAAVMKDDLTKKEIEIASEERALEKGIMDFGELSPYTCPECHGVLTRLQNDNIIRYRCHTGHGYTVDTLMAALTEKIEDALYNAIRGMDESIILLNHLGDHYAEANQPKLAALYFKKAKEASDRSNLVRNATMMHEQLNKDSMLLEAEGERNITDE